MQTRRNALKKSAAVAGLLASTGMFPQFAFAFNTAAFDAKSVADALKALVATYQDILKNGTGAYLSAVPKK